MTVLKALFGKQGEALPDWRTDAEIARLDERRRNLTEERAELETLVETARASKATAALAWEHKDVEAMLHNTDPQDPSLVAAKREADEAAKACAAAEEALARADRLATHLKLAMAEEIAGAKRRVAGHLAGAHLAAVRRLTEALEQAATAAEEMDRVRRTIVEQYFEAGDITGGAAAFHRVGLTTEHHALSYVLDAEPAVDVLRRWLKRAKVLASG